MASWIVHLRIAEILLHQIDGLDEPLFAVGNIAPDSGIPDEKWENFTPPPKITHFHIDDHSRYRIADLNYYREWLVPLKNEFVSMELYSFRLGYLFHLITDNLWMEKIGKPTQKRYQQEFAADKDFIWEVKKDWYGLDHQYVRSHLGCIFWRVFLNCSYQRTDLDFLPVEAVQQRIAYIKDYYQSNEQTVLDMLNRPYIYLSKGQMDAFVEESAQTIVKIYQKLRCSEVLPAGYISCLELV